MRLKAQGLIEIGLVLAFIIIIAVATFSPLGEKIQNSLAKMSPQKNLVADTATLNTLTGSQANTDTLTANISALQSSSDISAKEAASFITDTMTLASKVSAGNNSILTNDEVELVATAMKTDNTAETSGSLASLIAINTDVDQLSATDLALLNETTDLLQNQDLSVNTAAETLVSSINTLVSGLSTLESDIKSELLNYDLSPVSPSTSDLNALLNDSFLLSDAATNINDNVLNSVLLAENILSSTNENISDAIKQQAQSVIDAFKKALSIN